MISKKGNSILVYEYNKEGEFVTTHPSKKACVLKHWPNTPNKVFKLNKFYGYLYYLLPNGSVGFEEPKSIDAVKELLNILHVPDNSTSTVLHTSPKKVSLFRKLINLFK